MRRNEAELSSENKKGYKKMARTRSNEQQGRLASVGLSDSSDKSRLKVRIIRAAQDYIRGRQGGKKRTPVEIICNECLTLENKAACPVGESDNE